MDYLSIIKRPIETELDEFISLFNRAFTHDDGMLGAALNHIVSVAGSVCVLY